MTAHVRNVLSTEAVHFEIAAIFKFKSTESPCAYNGRLNFHMESSKCSFWSFVSHLPFAYEFHSLTCFEKSCMQLEITVISFSRGC